MLNRLAMQNACRLWRDYLHYFLTLCVTAALMFSFHSLLFSKDIYEMIHYGENGELSSAGTMLTAFLSVSTAVILGVAAWMMNYMTGFILEKRSREFAIYLLSGMRKNQIAALLVKENAILGTGALFASFPLGCGLRQALFFLFYKSVGKHYQFSAESLQISLPALLLTILSGGICFAAALLWNQKKFSRMEIIGLLHMDRQNEKVDERKNVLWKGLFFLSAGNILFLYFLIFSGKISKWTAILEMTALVFTFFFFYLGLSGFLMKYVRNRGRLVYKKEFLFLIRQFSSKIRNTCFVLGALSLLFMFALVGSSLAFMLSDYQNKQLDVEYPFDIIIISEDTETDFSEEEKLIEENIMPKELFKYCVYQNGTSEAGDWLYLNLNVFSDRDKDPVMAEGRRAAAYYDHDVYMGITDYNKLRNMLGLKPAVLRDDQYLIHVPNRIYQEISDKAAGLEESLPIGLAFAGFQTEGFAQNGHNGTDYLIVVPDRELAQMNQYFSLMAVMAEGGVPERLSDELYALAGKTRGYDELADYIRIGTETLFLMPASIQVKSREVLELRFLMSALSFPLFYIGLVFLCVSFTVLSVQQTSDVDKYKFRYRILYLLGMGRKQIRRTLAKQMFFYYLCPVILAAAVSAAFVIYVGHQFVVYTGIHTPGALYFGISLGGFLGIYVLYFGLTCFYCRRNICTD